MNKIYVKNMMAEKDGAILIDYDNLNFKFNNIAGMLFASSSISSKTSELVLVKIPDWGMYTPSGKKKIEIKVFNNFVNMCSELVKSSDHILHIVNSTTMLTMRVGNIEKAIIWADVLKEKPSKQPNRYHSKLTYSIAEVFEKN